MEYREGIYIGYRYYQKADIATAFPFGFGLSYTTFEYSDISVKADSVSFTVTNTGNAAGKEISQLYISAPGNMVLHLSVSSKDLQKTSLKPGESKRVTIPLDDKAFRYWNVKQTAGSRKKEFTKYLSEDHLRI